MTVRKNVAIVLVALSSIWFTSTNQVFGHRRARRTPYVPSFRVVSPDAHRSAVSGQPRYWTAWPSSYYDYPKYTGAFHARYFDELPSIYGTRPMRGTAW